MTARSPRASSCSRASRSATAIASTPPCRCRPGALERHSTWCVQPGCRTGAGRAGGSPPPALGAHDRRVRGTRRHGGGPHASTQAAAARFRRCRVSAGIPAEPGAEVAGPSVRVPPWLAGNSCLRPAAVYRRRCARRAEAEGPEDSATSEFVRLTDYDQLLGSPASSIASTRCSL
jgi:hypothetical protein